MPIVKDVPGVGRVEFTDEAAALKFEQSANFSGGAGGPFEQTLGQKAERGFDVGREAIVSMFGSNLPSASEQIGLEEPGTSAGREPIPRMIADLLLPESIPEAAGEAAIMLMSGGTSLPGQVGRKFAQRTLIPPTVAATTATITGTESPAGAAAKTAIGTFIPEFFGAAKRGVQNFIKKIVTRKGIRTQGLKDVADVSRALIKDVPVFKKLLEVDNTTRAAGKLNLLTDPENGLRVLKDQFGEFDDVAVRAFKGRKIDFPFEARIKGSGSGPGLPAVTKLNIKESINEVRRLKEVARNAPPGVETFPLREQAREAEGILKQALFDEDPKLLIQYETAVEEFGKGRGVLDILRESGAITGDEATSFVDLAKLGAFLGDPKNISRFPESSFTELFKAARRGGAVGARDVISQITARGFAPRTAVTPGAGISLPLGTSARRAGLRAPVSAFEGTGPQLLGDLVGTRALFGGLPSERVRKSRKRSKLQESPFEVQ